MLSVSIGCTNENTYGLSCHRCGECGRKFTVNGVDDSEVINKKVNSYKEFLNSESWKNVELTLKNGQIQIDK